jgi:hypothetical protein
MLHAAVLYSSAFFPINRASLVSQLSSLPACATVCAGSALVAAPVYVGARSSAFAGAWVRPGAGVAGRAPACAAAHACRVARTTPRKPQLELCLSGIGDTAKTVGEIAKNVRETAQRLAPLLGL